MVTHVFSIFEDGGDCVSIEVHTVLKLESPEHRAKQILFQHPGAKYVKVKRGGEDLATIYRS